MRAAVMRQGAILADTLPDPEPGPGEVLVRTLACGICGSDLHALTHAEKMVAAARASGAPFSMDLARDVVMGHEFCAEVVGFGPKTSRRLAAGSRVVSMPVLFRDGRVEAVGYSNEAPGGYGELMVLSEPLLLPVPDGLSTELAALTEPMAVGIHAVAKGGLTPDDAPLVVGCGPVGLAVIAALRRRRAAPIVAADFSPLRRRLAEHLGAHVVVDPRERAAHEAWSEAAAGRPALIFECVGVPGLIDQILRHAPPRARVVVAGVCMEEDRIHPLMAVNKELALQFVFGYAPEEFAEALRALAEGAIDAGPLLTGRVGIDGVGAAFRSLATPDAHAKILVEPGRG